MPASSRIINNLRNGMCYVSMMARSSALALLLFAAGPRASAQEARPIAFVNVAVLPMDSARAVPHQTVIVEQGRIASVGPALSIPVPEDALVVDGEGRYLMPGLADMHVHLTHPEPGTYYREDNRASFGLLLAHGVTTIRNMWGTPGLLALRDSASAGLILGPRITTTGPFVEDRADTAPGPWSAAELDNDPFIIRVRTEADGRTVAQYHAAVGYDYVKVRDRIPAAAYRGLTDEATRLGLQVVGHAPWAVGLGAVLTGARQGSIEHYIPFADLAQRSDSPARSAEQWYDRVWGTYAHDDPERLGLLAEITTASDLWVTPTLFVAEWYSGPQPDMLARLLHPDVVRYTSADQRESWREYAEGFATNYAVWGLDMEAERGFALRLVKALDSAGTRLLLGTDATPAMGIQGLAVHEELALLVEAGLTPFAALRTATVNAQSYLREAGLGDASGTIREGEPADLVLVDANPLDDIGHTRRIRGVLMRGRWLDRDALDGLLDAAEARYR